MEISQLYDFYLFLLVWKTYDGLAERVREVGVAAALVAGGLAVGREELQERATTIVLDRPILRQDTKYLH